MDRGVGVFVGMGGGVWVCVCAPPRSSPRLLPPHQHLLSTPEGLPGEFPESRGRGCPAPPLQTGAAQADPRASPREGSAAGRPPPAASPHLRPAPRAASDPDRRCHARTAGGKRGPSASYPAQASLQAYER